MLTRSNTYIKQNNDTRYRLGDGKSAAVSQRLKQRLTEGVDEEVPVPLHHIGRVIGKKGQMLREIRRETGAQVIVENEGKIVYLRGTKEQREGARAKIQAIIDDVSDNNEIIIFTYCVSKIWHCNTT